MVLGIGFLVALNTLGIPYSLYVVLMGHVVVSVPYAVLVILPRLRTLDPAIHESARDLGATELAAFRHVTMPLILPALVASFLVAFTISFDEYAITSFIVPSGEATFPIFIYGAARTIQLRPQMVALAAVVILISLVIVVVTEVGRRWAERRLEGQISAAAE